jgi:hypothetical protein
VAGRQRNGPHQPLGHEVVANGDNCLPGIVAQVGLAVIANNVARRVVGLAQVGATSILYYQASGLVLYQPVLSQHGASPARHQHPDLVAGALGTAHQGGCGLADVDSGAAALYGAVLHLAPGLVAKADAAIAARHPSFGNQRLGRPANL